MTLSSNLRKALLLFSAAMVLFGLVKSPMFGYDEIIGQNGGGFAFGFSISSFVLWGVLVLGATLYFGRQRS